MKWDSLISTQNLKLAWRRINTGRNLQYKQFFRAAYLVYEGNVDEYIKGLHKTLKAKAWSPHHATRVYLPKPSGLQRPLSLLDIEDQIVLQAISNKFATKLYRKRQQVELETVFSNKLSSPRDSIFFMERWQATYRAFQNKCTEVFNLGFKWSAHFDLSAYYDTISHELLLSIVSPNQSEPGTLDIIKKWLRVWSADNIAAMTAHGIPQGPIASDFIAEAFFLPIDFKLQNKSFCYLRYVDDIRLFGRTENEVREAAILLEQECRHRGLIPQSSKFEVRELLSPDDAMGSLPSISPADGRDLAEQPMTAEEARSILASAIKSRPYRIVDKSRFRYVMYRAPDDNEVLRIVLKLLPRHPEHIDSVIAYFANFKTRRAIARAALDYLISGVPYSYVRGALWHVVARFAGQTEMHIGLPTARADARIRSRCVVLSWGVMHFLMKCESVGLSGIGRRLSSENPISRSLLAPIFADREFARGGHAMTLLKGTLMEQLAGARELQQRQISLKILDLKQRDLPISCRNALASLGVIKRNYNKKGRDFVGEALTELYKCKKIFIWHRLLGAEYEHALQILIEAKARFQGAYSEWLALQDSFNDIVIRKFFGFLKTKNLQGYSKIRAQNGKLVKYGNLLLEGSPFDKAYPKIAKDLRFIHKRRNNLPGSHPYDEKGGSKNVWLKKRERDLIIPKIKAVLDFIVTTVNTHP
ncbi:MAG: hypothetical protein JW832_11740 [Deltaproteobacteria bacterium]|nr:hypothetical protein [Deltaproteobacteria bacterium]